MLSPFSLTRIKDLLSTSDLYPPSHRLLCLRLIGFCSLSGRGASLFRPAFALSPPCKVRVQDLALRLDGRRHVRAAVR